jgi:prepilin-type N-terminal cleavage/methylation domain-containing protein
MLKTKKHFTIIELLVVIAIISILAALILGGVASARESARQTQAKTECQQLAAAIEQYLSTYKIFPVVDPSIDTDSNDTVMLEVLQGNNARKIIFYKNSSSSVSIPWDQNKYYTISFDDDYDTQVAGDNGNISGTVAVWTNQTKDNDTIRSWTTDVD